MKVSSSKSFVSIGILAFIAFIGTGALAADTATIDKQVAGTLTRFDATVPQTSRLDLARRRSVGISEDHQGRRRCGR